MNTRFSSLVTVKKNEVDKSERAVQNANKDFQNATQSLELSYSSLGAMELPKSGTIAQMLASRTLINSQRTQISQHKEWLEFASSQLKSAQKKLKLDMIEFEKFKYLELEEMKQMIKQKKIEEAKELDEIALMTYKKTS